jgi:hypothetical protein
VVTAVLYANRCSASARVPGQQVELRRLRDQEMLSPRRPPFEPPRAVAAESVAPGYKVPDPLEVVYDRLLRHEADQPVMNNWHTMGELRSS